MLQPEGRHSTSAASFVFLELTNQAACCWSRKCHRQQGPFLDICCDTFSEGVALQVQRQKKGGGGGRVGGGEKEEDEETEEEEEEEVEKKKE